MTTDFPALTQTNNNGNNIRLRFINDNEIRTLNAEHAAKHRRCLFSGLSWHPVCNFGLSLSILIPSR